MMGSFSIVGRCDSDKLPTLLASSPKRQTSAGYPGYPAFPAAVAPTVPANSQ